MRNSNGFLEVFPNANLDKTLVDSPGYGHTPERSRALQLSLAVTFWPGRSWKHPIPNHFLPPYGSPAAPARYWPQFVQIVGAQQPEVGRTFSAAAPIPSLETGCVRLLDLHLSRPCTLSLDPDLAFYCLPPMDSSAFIAVGGAY